MGNKQQTECNTTSRPFWKSKFSKSKKQPNKYENFIIEFSQSYDSKLSRINDIESLDQRRVIFVSLIGLFQTYKKCPVHILYSSLFVLPIKKEWLYNLSKYINKNILPLDNITKLSIFNSARETDKYIQMLKWKDRQGLLFCMLDKYENNEMSMIHPFWSYFSNKLSTLYDVMTGNKYNALNLQDKWWENRYDKHTIVSKYGANKRLVLSELYFLTMKFKAMKEIIYESNPESLNVISFYGENKDLFLPCSSVFFVDHKVEHVKKNDNISWYISTDYEM